MKTLNTYGEAIIGVKNMGVEYRMDGPSQVDISLLVGRGFDMRQLINANWGDMFFGNVIVTCKHCGQWGAVKTACKHCGAPIPIE